MLMLESHLVHTNSYRFRRSQVQRTWSGASGSTHQSRGGSRWLEAEHLSFSPALFPTVLEQNAHFPQRRIPHLMSLQPPGFGEDRYQSQNQRHPPSRQRQCVDASHFPRWLALTPFLDLVERESLRRREGPKGPRRRLIEIPCIGTGGHQVPCAPGIQWGILFSPDRRVAPKSLGCRIHIDSPLCIQTHRRDVGEAEDQHLQAS